MSDVQRDREERQHVIEVLQKMVDWMESKNYIVANPERRRALGYAIASIKTDLKYDLLYEETSGQADKPITKNCESCRYYGSHHKVCNYCYKCSLWTEQESTNKNDLGVDCIDRKKLIDWINIWDITPIIKNPLIRHIQGMPPVTPIRPKGHWISHGEHCKNLGVIPSGLGAYEWCSNCDCGIDVKEWHRSRYNYCPNCGADMREVEE